MPQRKTSKYIAPLTAMYADIPETKQEKAGELIRRLSDVLEMMDECKQHIADEGCVVPMSQGNYTITRENPYSKIYDAKHKLMLSTMDKLDKMLPETESKKDELMAFLDSGSE